MSSIQALIDFGKRGKAAFYPDEIRFVGVSPDEKASILQYVRSGAWEAPLSYDPFRMGTLVDKVAEKFNGRIRIRPKPSTADVPDGVVF